MTHFKYAVAVTAWTMSSIAFNVLLKQIFKQPRPNKRIYLNETDRRDGRQYGMPSGHAQIAATLCTFIVLQFHNNIVRTMAISQLLVTCWQRWRYRMHTVEQLAVGCVVGICFGYGLFQSVQRA